MHVFKLMHESKVGSQTDLMRVFLISFLMTCENRILSIFMLQCTHQQSQPINLANASHMIADLLKEVNFFCVLKVQIYFLPGRLIPIPPLNIQKYCSLKCFSSISRSVLIF